jgi:hypothetical protein
MERGWMLDDPRGDIVVRNDEWGGPTKTKIDNFKRHRRAGVEDGRDRVLQEVTIARDSLRQRFREESSAKQESRGGYCGWKLRAPSSWALAIEDPQEDHGRDGEKKWCVCVWCVAAAGESETQHQDWEATETKAGF